MSKKIGLWMLTPLLIAGIATGAYLYSNGDTYNKTVSNCSIKGSQLSSATLTLDSGQAVRCTRETRAMYSNMGGYDKAAGACPITGARVSSATLALDSGQSACCAREAAGTAGTINTSASAGIADSHQSCEIKQAEYATLKAGQSCTKTKTDANSESDATRATTITLSSK
jgi:hypothetical protein